MHLLREGLSIPIKLRQKAKRAGKVAGVEAQAGALRELLSEMQTEDRREFADAAAKISCRLEATLAGK